MILPSPLPGHPRLLARPGDWDAVRHRTRTDGPSRAIWTALLQRADAICTEPPLQRTMLGKRLLMVSRQALERIAVLAIADRVSGDARYGSRAIEEMLAVCRFSDWNPRHFLDTAEMCLAVSIGYDWLHDALSSAERDEIATAIVQLGIEPSRVAGASNNGWLTTDSNWAQVCHGGLSAGAIVIADRAPELAEAILARALAALPRAAATYAPDGAYPEGPMYWSYGTSYHVILAAALDALTGDAHGVDAYPGFARSAEFIAAMTAPSGAYFNYADCTSRRRLQAPLFWMARHYGHPEWLAQDLATLDTELDEYLSDPAVQYSYGMLPLALLWLQPDAGSPVEPPSFWTGGGRMPVATYRWGASRNFLGVKGGAAGLSHSHMDVGSFVFEANGERWAIDPGMQDYTSLEAAGVDLWNESQQDSQRWEVFRIGPKSHNILRFDGQPQLLRRPATFEATSEACIVDIGALCDDPITAARRRFTPQPAGVLIEDSWSADAVVTATAQWLTFAAIEPDGSSITLRIGEKRLRLQVACTTSLSVSIDDVSRPPKPYDAPNDGLKRIRFSCRANTGAMRIQATVLG